MALAAFHLDKPRIIRTAEAHEAALRELDRLMAKEPRRGSEEGDQLELLSLLIGDYESRTVTLGGKSTPQSIVEFMADQHDVSSGELAELLGGRSSLSLFRKGRPLSKGQIARLHARMGIPVELLFETEPVDLNATRRRRAAAAGASGRGRKKTAGTRSR